MVPSGEQEQEQEQDQQVAPPVPVVEPKVLRSRSRARSDGDGEPSTASPEQEQEQEQQLRRPRGRRGRKSNPDAPLDNRERIKRRVKYLLIKMRVDQNLLDAYSGEGWKGQSREKIRPERELQRAEAHILRCKLDIREAVHELDDMGLEGSLADDLFDSEGRIYHEEIFCAKCKSVDSHIENDIILCDGACNRGFHQFCLDPPLLTKDIPPGDEGWLCPVCECKMDCVELINAEFGSKYEVENSWEDFFSKEALKAAGGGTGDRAAGDWPSSDSEDDDYDPEAGEKRANSDEEGESEEGGSEEGEGKEGGEEKVDSEDEDSDYNVEDGEGREGGEDREGGENEEDSDSGSDFREDKGSPGSSDEEEEEVPSNLTNLKKLARKRKGKRRRKEESSKEESESSDSSGSDASDVSFFDEFKDGGPKLGSRRRDSQAQQSASDEEAIVIEGKRQRQALDYKKLHDEMFGDADDGDEGSEDEDFGPKRRRRRSVSDEPSRPRPPRVRRRKVKTSAGDAAKGVEADGVQTSGADAPKKVEADAMQILGGDAPEGVDTAGVQACDGDDSKRVDADGVQTPSGGGTKVADANDLPSGSQVDGAADTPGGDREKRMWRRLPDAAVEGLRRVVAVNALPSKPQKEALAAQLGLSFAQVHGWFKNQRHQALRKGLVTPKRPHLVASSSKGMNAAAANSASPQNLKTLNTDFTEKLDVVQIRLRELEKSLDVFAKETIEGAVTDGRAAVESQNTYELGGIGLPANGNHVVYVPAVEVTENATC